MKKHEGNSFLINYIYQSNMNKFLQITIILICVFSPVLAQQIEEFSIPRIKWSKWDVYSKNLQTKEAFLSSLFIDGQPLKIDSIPYFKVVNLDGLNDLDLIKTKGPDSAGLVIYTNHQSKLTKVYEDSVILIELSKETPISALSFKTQVNNGGDRFEINYLLGSIENGKLSYRINRTDMIAGGTKDVYKNMPPTYFKLKNGGTPLVEGPGLHMLIKTCSKSDVGFATGSVKNKSGDVWWKVYILESDYKFRMGWLKRTDVLTEYQK